MPHSRSETPWLLGYLRLILVQFPVWMAAGMFFAVWMVIVAGDHPVRAFLGGVVWGFWMWLVCGNLFAVGMVWCGTTDFPALDPEKFLGVLRTVADKSQLKILSESADEVVLGPKRVLIRFRLQETRVIFREGRAVVIGPALAMWSIKRRLGRALAQSPTE